MSEVIRVGCVKRGCDASFECEPAAQFAVAKGLGWARGYNYQFGGTFYRCPEHRVHR